jgi:CubicO group peptidase (beta-lactamase class C family)
MFTSHRTAAGKDIQYGYGWEISNREGLGRVITHNGGGLTGNSILVDFPDKQLTIVMLGNRVTYELLGPVPLVVRLPADETSYALARNLVEGDFSRMPSATFILWPYALVLALVLSVIALAVVYLLRRRRRRARLAVA